MRVRTREEPDLGMLTYVAAGEESEILTLHAAVDEARAKLKPEIPREGANGIPLRDELVLEMHV